MNVYELKAPEDPKTPVDNLDDITDNYTEALDSAFPSKDGKFYKNFAKRVPNIAKRMQKLATKYGCGEDSDRKRRNAAEVIFRTTRSTGEPACDDIIEVSRINLLNSGTRG